MIPHGISVAAFLVSLSMAAGLDPIVVQRHMTLLEWRMWRERRRS